MGTGPYVASSKDKAAHKERMRHVRIDEKMESLREPGSGRRGLVLALIVEIFTELQASSQGTSVSSPAGIRSKAREIGLSTRGIRMIIR